MHLVRVLERFHQHLSATPPPPPVAVFDLDSTLFSTCERNLAILREYAGRSEAPADLRRIVEQLEAAHMGWNPMADVHARGFTDREGQRALRRFWFDRFFTSEYLKHDLPTPGASEYVRDVFAAGGRVVYLTGRPLEEMGEGTRQSLAAHGFPLDDERAVLLLKPTFSEPDIAFKTRVVDDLRKLGPVLAAFENEPVNANLFHDAFPEADIVFLETMCSADPPPLRERIVRVKDFRR